MHALIDGDIVVFKAAFACQQQYYSVSLKGQEKEIEKFRYKRDMTQWMNQNGSEEKYDYKLLAEATAKFPEVAASLKNMMSNIRTHTGHGDFTIFLTKGKTFRHKFYDGYKANRVDKPKPIFIAEAYNYVQKTWGNNCYYEDGLEADDTIGIANANIKNSVVCSIDKDLRMLPGKHLNINKYDFSHVSPLEAAKNFFKQVLIGDTIDNIPGLAKVGDKTAIKLLSKKPSDWLLIVAEKYKTKHPKDFLDRLNLTSKLIWILRDNKDINFTGIEDIYCNHLQSVLEPYIN